MKITQETKLLESPEVIKARKQKLKKIPSENPKNKPLKYGIVVRRLEQAFSIGCTVIEACVYAGIHRDTYYRWLKNNATLSDRFEALREKPILAARQTVVGDLGDIDTAKWYLERKRKREFSIRQEHTGDDGGPIKVLKKVVVEFRDFSDDNNSK